MDSTRLFTHFYCGIGSISAESTLYTGNKPINFKINMTKSTVTLVGLLFTSMAVTTGYAQKSPVGVGTKAPADAEVFFDGTRQTLDQKWMYWDGPRLAATMPIKWQLQKDPVDTGMTMNTNDPAAANGKYGAADIVTRKKFRDHRVHVEFLVMKPGGNSGVYLQNRHEIQIFDGDTTTHGLGAVINESPSPYAQYTGIGKWNAYDIVFRAARFENGKRTEKALITMYFNGKKVHKNQAISQVWGGPYSGTDGGNDDGKGITDTPGGLKLQAEGHDVLYRNIWIKELILSKPDTDF